MATIAKLEADGALIKISGVLYPHELECREIYGVPRFVEWLDGELADLGSTWRIETSPREQVAAYIDEFVSGGWLEMTKRVRQINPVGEGVWELKTADVRIFGWFARRDCFIAVLGIPKQRLMDVKGLYDGALRQVVMTRERLDLDEPKFIASTDGHDVLSNCYS